MVARFRLFHRGLQVILLTFLASFIALNASPVHAVETYSLAISPGRIQESNTPGTTLVLTVSNALSQPYTFVFSVTDPTPNTKTASVSVSNTQSSFSVSVVYPRDFGGGASVNNVGTYSVSVSQTSPLVSSPVASGSFLVGLTDSPTYQRTFTVSILAQGYAGSELLTLSLTRLGVPVTGFPIQQPADTTGRFSFSWQVPPNLPTGNYTVSLAGTTVKTPPDTQTFTIYPTRVNIPQLTMAQSSLQRSLSEGFSFTATYLSGVPVQSGSLSIRITETDGTTSHSASASYNATLRSFAATYRIPLSGQVGAWVGTVDVNSFDDGYGNVGPSASVVHAFTVQQALLSVTLSINNKTYTTNDLVVVSAAVTAPDGSTFNSGTVAGSLSRSGTPVGGQISLSYVQSQGRWVGSYTVNATSPSGLWLIQVRASDIYGNAGQGSTLSTVSVPQQNPVFSYWFLFVLLLVGAALLVAVLFLKRRRIFRRELEVDLRAVGLEAQKIENQEFFKSVKEQLTKHRDAKDEDG